MMKIKAIIAAVVVVGVSTTASAMPPTAPSDYSEGPFPPIASTTRLNVHERAAYAMMEGIMQIAEGKIHSTGCGATTQPVEVYSDSYPNGNGNIDGDASVGSSPNSFDLVSEALPSNFRGQKVTVAQSPLTGFLDSTPVGGYSATFAYNSANNMMTGAGSMQVLGASGQLDQYFGRVIKDFHMNGYIVEDWGLQFLSKMEYPVEKWWQRSKGKRSDGTNGRTVFVKDRLVGNTKCRITLDLSGISEPDLFWQSGDLIIEQVAPSVDVQEFSTGF